MMMSGHCSFPATERMHNGKVEPVSSSYSHEHCTLGGCPCGCHLGDSFECGCGKTIREAPLMDNIDEPGEMVYVHVDPTTGRALGEEC